jgi:hypothetical protein
MLQSDTELINSIAQKIRFWPPELVAHFSQAFDPDRAFVERLRLQRIEPLEDRHGAVLFFVEDHVSLRNLYAFLLSSSSQNCEVCQGLALRTRPFA